MRQILTLTLIAMGPVLAFAQSTTKAPEGAGGSTSPQTANAPKIPEMTEKDKQWLDAYLKAWEDRMSKIASLETHCILTTIDGTTKTVHTGEAALMRPNFAKMFLKNQAEPTNVRDWQHFIADGSYFWEYKYKQKVAMVQQLPTDGISMNSTPMAFLFGMKAKDIKERYHLYLDSANPEKNNENFVFIDIWPKRKDDMQEFARAQLVLWRNNKEPKFADYWMLPARLWFQHPNKNQVMWEFKAMNTKKEMIKKDFAAPTFQDKEWRYEWAVKPTATSTSGVKPASGTSTPKK